MTTGIPTTYNGVRFRSRLEAKWAAFFDLINWPWQYEPFDLEGYIPDFVLTFHKPLLVEVKPVLEIPEMKPAGDKIEQSGWKGESLIVGAGLWHVADIANSLIIGQLDERHDHHHWWSHGRLFTCSICKRVSVFHSEGSFTCRVSGCYDGDHHLGDPPSSIMGHWLHAANLTQWRGR